MLLKVSTKNLKYFNFLVKGEIDRVADPGKKWPKHETETLLTLEEEEEEQQQQQQHV
jgi:hypothetical protein